MAGIAIDNAKISAMVAQLREAAGRAHGADPVSSKPLAKADPAAAPAKLDFAAALKNSLDQVNASQKQAEVMGQRFALGDDSVNLSDVMIASQKAGIAFQATVQVRNKLVSAYHDIMNMPV